MRPSSEKRKFGRIQHVFSVSVEFQNQTFEAELQSLSKEGASLTSIHLPVSLHDQVKLGIEHSSNPNIELQAKIIWVKEEEQPPVFGVKFESPSSSQEGKILSLMKDFLNDSPRGGRRHPRISRRVPARFSEEEELKAMLENISLGGLALIVETPLQPQDQIEVEIFPSPSSPPLIVGGRVVYCTSVKQTGRSAYRVGVEFKELTEKTLSEIQQLMDRLMELT